MLTATSCSSPARAVRTALAALALLVAGACSDLTDVEERDVIELSDVQNATGAAALRAGALSSFNATFGQSISQILLSGLLSDELMGAAPGLGALDRRSIADPSSDLVYGPLHTARIRISSAIPVVQQRSNTPRWVSELFALQGYTEIFFGENYCSGVPLGTIVDGLPVYGQPLTTAQMFEQAVQNFDSALVYVAADTDPGSDSVRTLARVGEDVPCSTSASSAQRRRLWPRCRPVRYTGSSCRATRSSASPPAEAPPFRTTKGRMGSTSARPMTRASLPRSSPEVRAF
ncbi:MAG: hypothetical protein ACREON_05250 [Gemmatimonadaceae bacterium]